LRTSTQWQALQVFPATPTRKTGYNGWNPRNGETHIISKNFKNTYEHIKKCWPNKNGKIFKIPTVIVKYLFGT
jgi:hypothetical protein